MGGTYGQCVIGILRAAIHCSLPTCGAARLFPFMQSHIGELKMITGKGAIMGGGDAKDRIRLQVMADLQEYASLKKKLALLKFECAHPQQVTENEVITQMALSHPISEGIQKSGYISDKTMRIALQFQDRKEQLNRETINEIVREMTEIEMRLQKIEFYVQQLDTRQETVIRAHYFEGKTWVDLQKQFHLSVRALLKRRDAAVDELVSMYLYLQSIKKEPDKDKT